MLKRNYWLPCLLAIAMSACNKKNADQPPPKEDIPQGIVTPVGVPDNTVEVITKTIGPNGGSITSGDRSVVIDIPAGALSKDEQVSIQRITNNCPGHIGHAYRLKPEGVTFAKPVTVKMWHPETNGHFDSVFYHYQYIRAAYQDKNGMWTALTKASTGNDWNAVYFETTHFSDWSLIPVLKIEVSPRQILPNAKSTATVKYLDDLLAPLSDKGKEILLREEYKPLNSAQVRNWTLSGEGKISPNGNSCVYTAPGISLTQAIGTALLDVEVQLSPSSPEKIYMNAKVSVVHGYVLADRQGAGEILLPGLVKELGTGSEKNLLIYQPSADGGTELSDVKIEVPYEVGNYPIKSNSPKRTMVKFYFGIEDRREKWYHSMIYNADTKLWEDSEGSVTITNTLGDFVQGHFVVEKCGEINYPNSMPRRISGIFKARKLK
ncbi:hypothetical protein [Chitinophaga caseinilytica]|uniref:hypothetical protein n=1 Tax=Chitinophaga caseinilytica TaxID=2267521 RepID=UPI003C2EBBE2